MNHPKHKKKRNKRQEEAASYKRVVVYTIAGFLCLLPLCVYSHLERLSPLAARYFSHTQGYTAEFFLYHKEMLLTAFAAWLILFFVGEHIYPKNPVKEIPLRSREARVTLILAGTYALLVLLSTLFARDRRTALVGSCTEYEGVLALLAYIILFLAGYNYFREERCRKLLKGGIVILMTVVSLLALTEYFYGPIYELPFMKYLIAPKELREMAASLSGEVYRGRITLSFYNPAYLGGLCAMMLPICFGFAWEEKQKLRKILYLLLVSGICFTLVGCGTSGPFFAAVVGMAALFLALQGKWRQLLCTLGELLALLAVGFLLVNTLSQGRLGARIASVVTNGDAHMQANEKFALKSMELKEGELKVSSKEAGFSVRVKGSIEAHDGMTGTGIPEFLEIRDETGAEITGGVDKDGGVLLEGEEYEAVRLYCDGSYLLLDLGYEDTVNFYVTAKGLALIGQNGDALLEIPQPEVKNSFLRKLYPLATGRGYAWVNTLPILKESLLLGKGPGHFVYSFPQHEVVGLMNTHGNYRFVIDKPHNWYLQIAVNTGVLSLLAVLWLMLRYFIRGAGYVMRKKAAEVGASFEKALWAGLLAFCITGVVNDSIVAVNPIFWIMFGIGSCEIDFNPPGL